MPDVVDLNCDVGEGAGFDSELMPFITSANIACGGHAGYSGTMRSALIAARGRGVACGAHPGFADREHFGRRELLLSASEVTDLVTSQIVRLKEIAGDEGVTLTHVKPHGALYNMSARDEALAGVIARAVASVDSALLLFGLAGSASITAAQSAGLRAVSEGFADRNYLADGSLVPRSRADAMLHDPVGAARRALRMVRDGRLPSVDSTEVHIVIETLCVHGDTTGAPRFVRELRRELERNGVRVRAPLGAP